VGSSAGRENLGWLLGDGETRGIALVFLVGGLIMVLVAAGAFLTRSYRTISALYLTQRETVEADAVELPANSRAAVAGEATVD
jgi:DHA3 family multidrug efflux protein-like MFS transporter